MATGIQMSKDIRVSYASWFSFQPGTVRVEKKLDAQDVAEVVREILEVQNKSETLGRVFKAAESRGGSDSSTIQLSTRSPSSYY